MKKKKTKTQLSKSGQAWGVVLIGVALLLLLALVSYHINDPVQLTKAAGSLKVRNWVGPLGAYVSYYLIQWTLGYPIVVLPIMLFLFALTLLNIRFSQHRLGGIYLILTAWAVIFSVALAMPEALRTAGHLREYYPSGLIGGWIAAKLVIFLGEFGAVALLAIVALALLITTNQIEIAKLVHEIGRLFKEARERWAERRVQAKIKREEKKRLKAERKAKKKRIVPEQEEEPPEKMPVEPEIDIDEHLGQKEKIPAQQEGEPPVKESEQAAESVQTSLDDILNVLSQQDGKAPDGDDEMGFEVKEQAQEAELDYDQLVKESVAKYRFPSTDLLFDPPANAPVVTREELRMNAETLEMKLGDFGVEAKVVRVTAGPVITLYELQPAPGVKISSIVSLANDLALALEAKGIRIIAPIPGKAAVGIEIPNRRPQTVYLKPLIRSEKFSQSGFELPLALGKTINGETYVADLTKMPHILIAGATGAGKSVGINTLIMSLLYAVDPGKVKFVMVDPKKLELSVYRDLRDHYLLWRPDLDEEVITKPNNAVSMLNSIVLEMEKRYNLLADLGARNIVEYNKRVQNAGRKKDKKHQLLPYIVVVVDELADLMIVAAKEVEAPIARLAQMARAVGIHLVVATQRPSVDVITGVIKANFPARIAYQVATKVDSRTVIDMNGAEQLLGNGDMLFIPPGRHKPIRLQNPFVSTEEVEAVIAHIKRQQKLPNYAVPQPAPSRSGFGADTGGDVRDPLYKEARAIVVQHQQGSISFLQRRLQIGYSRAARLMDQLEEDGVVGPPDGSKPREVRITLQELQDMD